MGEGCQDNSDISMVANQTSNPPCGNTYTNEYIDSSVFPVDWKWFHCQKTKRCIHISHRCNLHPHPDCIYEKDGVRVAEDEEGCLTEYKRKGLIQDSANFICQSQLHNTQSKAVLSVVRVLGELI